MTATTKKKKPKVKPHALTFANLMRRIEKHPAFPVLLRAAKETGWLTDEYFMTRLTDKEADEVREVYNKTTAAKRAAPTDFSKAIPALPTEVGPLVEDTKATNGRVRLSTNNRTVAVDAFLFLTMQKRHPSAHIYLSRTEDGPVIFSEKGTVAVLAVDTDD